ncbi:zinc ribbon domain-containing protein [Saccharothrix longispora]|uniref:Nucleic acid-binding Zn-ribbon protein n=1 Tax=Saccharothrix longispora TaxID=33920 RepID=A0ABU1Q5X9_9PSEU|nr:C4-type zinc ribbon domain-containing protein [Saccharothrix longispora]MDR6598298.1 putative nucleic acid-binding Zn-ribbon protein [Saccharothrix longispora]
MKADPAVQRRLLDLAQVDAELARVTHRRRTLPEIAEIAEAEKQFRAKQDAVTTIGTRLGDLNREVKRQETEIDQVRAREERDRKLLAGGSVGAKQLTDLEHELATLNRRRGALEDDLLELMERREAVEADSRHAQVELDKAQEALSDAARRRDSALADLESTEAKRTAERTKVTAGFPEPLLALYDRVRAHKGIGAALLQSRRCGACRIELDRSAMSRVKEAATDEVVQCEECDAIMVRTGESGL